MTVYVDNMRARLGRLILCHMVADSEDELHAMADRIGLARRHYQGDHYDVGATKRALAVAAGAVEISMRQLGCMVANRKRTGILGDPEAAIALHRQLRAAAAAAASSE